MFVKSLFTLSVRVGVLVSAGYFAFKSTRFYSGNGLDKKDIDGQLFQDDEYKSQVDQVQDQVQVEEYDINEQNVIQEYDSFEVDSDQSSSSDPDDFEANTLENHQEQIEFFNFSSANQLVKRMEKKKLKKEQQQVIINSLLES